jgi:hypothetical protein
MFSAREKIPILFGKGTMAREKLGAIFDMDGVLVDSSDAH